ncbi:MAG TPA: ankyrin repeat domain-containing protein [Kofleriaceae bacterium]
MSWWKKWFSRGDKATAPSAKTEKATAPSAKTEKARWLASGDPGNPFPAAILDLMVTQTLLATSTDPDIAARSVSWQKSIGDDIDDSLLADAPAVACTIQLPVDRALPRGLLFAPTSMDQKWVIAWRPPHQIIAARSWTGAAEASAHARIEGSTLIIEHVRAIAGSPLVTFGSLPMTFEWLLRSHALGERIPFPVDNDGAVMFENAPLAAFSAFGNIIFCAAKSWLPPTSKRPLRSDGRVIRAVRDRNASALATAVEAGDDVDAPSTFGGYTALHLAVIRDDVEMFERLVSLDAKLDRRADGGMFALGMAVVHKVSPALFAAMEAHGVDLLATNDDGFNALHAACEVGNAWAVRWLHERGHDLEARTGRGHTALQIACALGHLEAAQALVALGASVDAPSPDGTAVEIAKREGRDDVEKWLRAR